VKDTKKEEELREPFQHKLLVKCKSKARRLQQSKILTVKKRRCVLKNLNIYFIMIGNL